MSVRQKPDRGARGMMPPRAGIARRAGPKRPSLRGIGRPGAPRKALAAALAAALATTALAATAVAATAASPGASREGAVEDFESGPPILAGYPGQDVDPEGWELSAPGHAGSGHALRLFGNSWKVQSIPARAVADTTVWEVAVLVERLGEMQAFGVGDGAAELLYTLAGEQLPQENRWWTAYQGAYPRGEWRVYRLPLGRDWRATHGYLPQLDRLFYINDDDAGVVGAVLFDDVRDVTGELARAPRVRARQAVQETRRLAKNLYRVGVRFWTEIDDPDSPWHDHAWEFGDGAASDEAAPVHVFTAQAGHTYTVAVTVTDPDGLAGADTCQVRVEPGDAGGPVTVNFVGDVMTARAFETPGGIIDTRGVEAIFLPTRPIFGDAAEINVCNLECSYTDRGVRHPTKSVVFRSRPENIAGIVAAGVDIADIGNNHIIDYGEEGMLQTMALLDSLGIRRTGAGRDETEALRPTFLTARGVRLGFLGLSNRTGRQWNYQPFLDAAASKPGFAYLLPHNLQAGLDAARAVADVSIVQLHSGDEYQTSPPARLPAREPPVEADAIAPGDPDVRFCVEPSPDDRALRRLAIDLGADIVINHHPHVLQGFESHQGRLIAHSLGNFVFDLYYPETMPTIVLTLEVAKHGIIGCSLVPAWIDDNVPQPARGRLGREIMDRLADYSRPMGALVAVDAAAGRARVLPARAGVDSTVASAAAESELTDAGGWALTPPLALEEPGSLSAVTAIAGDGGGAGWEVAWGREILWHGGFEDEGATLWALDAPDEWLDPSRPRSGELALAQRRTPGTPTAYTGLERLLPCDAARRHTLAGWISTQDAAGVSFGSRFYSGRSTSSQVGSAEVTTPLAGTQEWKRYWREVPTPASAAYCQVVSSNQAPSSGTALAWFDDLALIEWEPWRPWTGRLDIPAPNNLRHLQLRRPGPPGGERVAVTYETTAYAARPTSAGHPAAPPAAPPRLSCRPNPFNARVRLELTAPAASASPSGPPRPASLAVYDLRGRRVATLFAGLLAPGQTVVLNWDGTGDGGRTAASGIYFARALLDGRSASLKLTMIK